jgi:hypothetical protein
MAPLNSLANPAVRGLLKENEREILVPNLRLVRDASKILP